jgi:hypothetical protein
MLDIKEGENPAAQTNFGRRNGSFGFGKSMRNRSGRKFRRFKAKN